MKVQNLRSHHSYINHNQMIRNVITLGSGCCQVNKVWCHTIIGLCLVLGLVSCKTTMAEDDDEGSELSQVESYHDACADEFLGVELQQCLALSAQYYLEGDIVTGCTTTFSKDRGRLLCLDFVGKHQLELGHIDICEEMFAKEEDEYRCLHDVVAMQLEVEEMDACRTSLHALVDVKQCFQLIQVRGLRSSQIDACGQSFMQSSEVLSCLNAAVEGHLLDSQIIDCRKQNQDSATHRINCIHELVVDI